MIRFRSDENADECNGSKTLNYSCGFSCGTEANFLFPGEFPVEGLLGVWKRFYSLQNDDLWAIVQVFLVLTYQEN